MKLPDLKLPGSGRWRGGRGGLRRGPEVRMPDFLVDLYADLRDRRLLPLVVLLIVAIIAAPILIGGSRKEKHAAPVVVDSHPRADNASFSVVPAGKELQDYKKRLSHRRSVNPFNAWSATKHRTPSRHEFEEVEEGQRVIEAEPPPAEYSSSGPGTATTVIERQPKVVKATLKAQVGVAAVLKAGFNGSGLEQVEVEDQTRLPQPDNTAVIYNGYSKKKNAGALFLMTSQVTEFSGEGHCALGGAMCQMIELKIGQSETFAIGYGETRYTVKLLGFEPIVKEEVIEAEGRKVRVPNHHGGKSGHEGTSGSSEDAVGTEPSPRLLLR